jgi:hypothetical protein
MASEKQIAANRINALKCTGPTSDEGKAISSQNAIKTGLDAKSELIPRENPGEYALLIAEYYQRFNPAAPEERCLVDALVKAEWLGRRYMCAAAAMWECQCEALKTKDLGRIFMRSSDTVSRAQRCISASQRDFASALKQLRDLQANRSAEPYIAPDLEKPANHPKEDEANKPLTSKLVSFPTEIPEAQPTAKPADSHPTPPAQKEQEPDEAPPIAA